MAKIKKIFAREILDGRGNPTIETIVILDNNLWASASVPAGASIGEYEALELRDGDQERFLGRGVLRACQNVNEIIAPVLIGKEVTEQKEIDKILLTLDGTKNKAKLGANAILSVSLAVARAGSYAQGVPLYHYLRKLYDLPLVSYELPTPLFNVINGGRHSDSGLDIQEFMIFSVFKASFREKLCHGVEMFNSLREILEKRKQTFAVGDEGGFAPKLKTTENTLDYLVQIAHYTKHRLGSEIFFGLDVASSVFYQKEKGLYFFEGKKRKIEKMIKIYRKLVKKYPLLFLEDPFAEDDWNAWQLFTEEILKIEPNLLIVGDDLFSGNLERVKKGIELKAANAIIIKPNQIGSLSETIECINFARKNNFKIVISHRAGETNDSFIADLAVAVNAEFIKAGAPNRGERIAKYNRLAEIEAELEG